MTAKPLAELAGTPRGEAAGEAGADPRSPGVWRGKHAERYDFLRRHTVTTAQLAERFFSGRTLEATRKKASRWLVKQRKRKKVRAVGVVQRRDTGRPEVVHGRRCKQDEIEHEVRVTDLALILNVRMERGVKVGTAEPDGMAMIDGRRCAFEIDNSGKMDAKQMKQKWPRYGKFDGFIMVVAVTEERMQRLIAWSDAVKEIALFTTFTRLLKVSEPWVDCTGRAIRLGGGG